MTELAQMLDDALDLESALEAVTVAAVELVDGADCAAITFLGPHHDLESVATTSPVATAVNLLAHQLQEGPCIDAATDERLVTSTDVQGDLRWPGWSAAVADMVSSVLAVQLVSARGVHGALTIYSSARDSFTAESICTATTLSIHAAIAMRALLLQTDMTHAVARHTLVGQARGILMDQFGLDADAAHDLVLRRSCEANLKVVEVARRLVADRSTKAGATPEGHL
ncbi:hypothetical protein SERN_2954 [Serinibacter arcticus]|uniref:ANTAR domain-containing protein n=2 Tax=Serinibacter arcticus TaxID=1655435 RepID=A0A4Z1E009_9MICO|nr:hypothetical protein SERN_2954 [Serinibacter arcticus]